MTDRDALYAAILANPDDDTPRLAFADYLEENSEAEYAAFIRKQIELARLPEWDPIRLRAEYLDHAVSRGDNWYGTKWCPVRLAEDLDWSGGPFRRGFPAALNVRGVNAFVNHASDVFCTAPVDELEVWGDQRTLGAFNMKALAGSPLLARVHKLVLPLAELDKKGLDDLCTSPHARGLIDLDVETSLSEGVSPARVFRGELIRQLHRLALHVPEQHTADTLAAIQKVRGPYRLQSLRLTSCDNTARPDLLCESGFYSAPLFGKLTRLNLSHNRQLAKALPLLLRAPFLDQLQSLRLNLTELGSDTQLLTRSPRLAQLQLLDLSQNEMKSKDVQALAKSPHMANLRVLNLDRNPIGNAGAVALAKSQHLRNLLVLNLMSCDVGDVGAQAFLDSPLAQTLVQLHLYSPGKAISPAMKRKLRKQLGARVRV